jgi:restriction system protein
MAIPDYQALMRPLLELLADGEDLPLKEIVSRLEKQFDLSEDEIAQILPSGQQTVFRNRVSWARSYLKAAGLVESPKRGIARITTMGGELLTRHQGTIDSKFLEKFPTFCEFKNKAAKNAGISEPNPILALDQQLSPEEQLEIAYRQMRVNVTSDLLLRLKSCTPTFFEHVVVELLMKMGYGGMTGNGRVTRQSNDGGIDGVINQDKLGLDIVCIQAKRWEAVVGRPTVQGFVGSMDYIRAKKGVIITTSKFSKDAEDYVDRIEGKKVVLIDGEELAELMIDHNLGVIVKRTYELKDVSNDFFEDE